MISYSKELLMACLFFWLAVLPLYASIVFPVTGAAQGNPPKIRSDYENKFRIPVGMKLFRLTCPVLGSDKSNLMIEWTKNGEQVDWDSRYKIAKDDRELRIRNIRLDDSGRFQCQATNGFGHQTIDFTVHVYDPNETVSNQKNDIMLSTNSSPPIWLTDITMETMSPKKINPGGRLEISCPAKGNPLPEISWYKDNVLLTQTPNHIATLVIDPVGVFHSGEYRCVLENKLGSIEAIFTVSVDQYFEEARDADSIMDMPSESLIPIIDQPYNISVRIGHTASFHCKAKATTSPLIRWLKEIDDPEETKREYPNATLIKANGMNLMVLDQTQRESMLEGIPENLYFNQLVIPLVTQDSAGRYICVVTSAAGHIVYKTAQLNVLPMYDLSTLGFNPESVWVYLIPVAVIFIFLVTGAVVWLKCNQEPSLSVSSDSKPPPPPRIPPPVAPTGHHDFNHEYPHHNSLNHTYNHEIEKMTRSPVVLSNMMFQQKRLPSGAATLDRNHMQRVPLNPRGFEEMSHFYDSESPQPYWTHQQHNPSIYTPASSGNYRTLEVSYPHNHHHRNYPSLYSEDYSEQDKPFIAYRR